MNDVQTRVAALSSGLNGRVLVVDDEAPNVILLRRLLQQAGYENVTALTDPRNVITTFLDERPDIVLLDLHMPHLTGYDVLRQLQPYTRAEFIPIVVLTADATTQAREEALGLGANDFLTKPFDRTEVVQRIANLLQTRGLHLELKAQNALLEDRVRLRTRDLDEARLEILRRLALAAEFRDDDTGQHTQRVGSTAARIALELGLPPSQTDLLRRAAPLHDVGKIGIPDAVLLKPGRLTPAEFDVIKTHTRIGAEILSGSEVPLLKLAETIARTHHERWDGRGYAGIAGEEIPLPGRIVAVADVFDALTHTRPYKQAWDLGESVTEIARSSRTQFDPEVVNAFLPIASEVYAAGRETDGLPARVVA